ncbi:DEAD/DEAH box helicase [Rothia dentocariosa]|uniref:DEAD/DEAH box helicase n=1 Tax=Rothia dentocariosa TaxID=2047 RepID=UPI00352DD06D
MTQSTSEALLSEAGSMNDLARLLNWARASKLNTREQGDYLEHLTKFYLTHDPAQQSVYTDVYLWKEWAEKNDLPRNDYGIDLVAIQQDGTRTAIQCKFFTDHSVQKKDVDSFLAASGAAEFERRLYVTTAEHFSKQVQQTFANQDKEVRILTIREMSRSGIDWDKLNPDFFWGSSGATYKYEKKHVPLKPKKTPRPHQTEAVQKVLSGLSKHDRGKLIMACGTGKTYTALHLAESYARATNPGKITRVLFLVPSLALMSQTVREWSQDATLPLSSYAVCSDVKVGTRKNTDSEDIPRTDLVIPSTTEGTKLVSEEKRRLNLQGEDERLVVVFATYHSIQAVHEAQKAGFKDFDLVICDEAHRTTGVTLNGEDSSNFVKVHDNDFIRAVKRVYMTATPRIFTDDVKNKASEANAVLVSMDDEATYGPVFYRIGFGEAVESGLLTDYKVLVLNVAEDQVAQQFQSFLADENQELKLDDVAKLVGCWNGLAKRQAGALSASFAHDPQPMRRAVAFNRSIKDSRKIADQFKTLVSKHLVDLNNDDTTDDLRVDASHIDGGFNAAKREKKLEWLSGENATQDGQPVCRILSNARCLTEGVDVPNLDAVLFLNPRNSVVDVIQAVGRVMRKAEGKKYGYIILPVAVPGGIKPSEALNDNKRYKVVWQVLQALRSHDERLDRDINQMQYSDKMPENIIIDGIDLSPQSSECEDSIGTEEQAEKPTQGVFPLIFNGREWKEAIHAKLVQKVGNRIYWDDWSESIAEIANKYIALIRAQIDPELGDPTVLEEFSRFIQGLRSNLNPTVGEKQAVEMLAQHLVTKPVFDALFESHEFTVENPISRAMQTMVDRFNQNAAFERERKALSGTYASIQKRASGLDSAAAKQNLIKDLYDKFFKKAFPAMAEKLGIVFTPTEVVDYILRSADSSLRSEFGRTLSDEGVSILEPFVGTGTFITRLLQLGLIRPQDLERKFKREIFANEMVLLSYYIAAINIETTFADVAKDAKLNLDYMPFEGMVLTDTFQLSESAHQVDIPGLESNSERAKRELEQPIQVIVMNPPYSAGQTSANDNNQNEKYPKLDNRIEETYVKQSSANLKNSLYDSYIRAIRWASDRISDNGRGEGVIAFVSNGGFIDGNAADGLRKSLMHEFSKIYIYNLRGNARTSGEQRRKEKDNIFGEGTRTPVAIAVLVKKAGHRGEAELYYRDIGDYLSREEKLRILGDEDSIEGTLWSSVIPDKSGDWINQRDESYEEYQPLGDKDTKGKDNTPAIFRLFSNGLKTNRDAWAYNFSQRNLEENMTRTIRFYNSEVQRYQEFIAHNPGTSVRAEDFVSADSTQVTWDRTNKKDCEKGIYVAYSTDKILEAIYRPFTKQSVYFDPDQKLNNCTYQMPQIFPYAGVENLAIITSASKGKEYSTLMVDTLPDLHLIGDAQVFSYYAYEKNESEDLFSSLEGGENGYTRRENITDATLAAYREFYRDKSITKWDIFYYIYALLHHPEYRDKYASNLAKELPRIPKVRGFKKYADIGRELADLHLNYENVEPYPLIEKSSHPEPDTADKLYEYYAVESMKYQPKKDSSKLVYNSHLILEGIPAETLSYQVNGKSALEWIVERYCVKTDKKSQITNNANDYSREVGNPRYIIDLVKRIVTVSLRTNELVSQLPQFVVVEE